MKVWKTMKDGESKISDILHFILMIVLRMIEFLDN